MYGNLTVYDTFCCQTDLHCMIKLRRIIQLFYNIYVLVVHCYNAISKQQMHNHICLIYIIALIVAYIIIAIKQIVYAQSRCIKITTQSFFNIKPTYTQMITVEKQYTFVIRTPNSIGTSNRKTNTYGKY